MVLDIEKLDLELRLLQKWTEIEPNPGAVSVEVWWVPVVIIRRIFNSSEEP